MRREKQIKLARTLSTGSVAIPPRNTELMMLAPVALNKAVTASAPTSETPPKMMAVTGAERIADTKPKTAPPIIVGNKRDK